MIDSSGSDGPTGPDLSCIDGDGMLRLGSLLGRYKIIRMLGTGGMGSVWEAQHVDLQKRVALKLLHPTLAKNTNVRRRFLQEGQAAGRISHPNAVTVSDVSDINKLDGPAYLVMEFLDGEPLSARLQREGALPLATIAELMLPVLSALSSAHRKGIVHRDIKPDNLFLARQEDGTVVPKVVDFGISKLAQEDGQTAHTADEAMLGTPRYMAPEQVRGAKNADARSDLYSLGVVLYECATGHCPFSGGSLFTVLNSVTTGEFRPLHDAIPNLPPRFAYLVTKAMALSPEDRFESVDALAGELLTFASPSVQAYWGPRLGVSTFTSIPPGQIAVPQPPPRRSALPFALAGVAVVVAVAAALVVNHYRGGQQPPPEIAVAPPIRGVLGQPSPQQPVQSEQPVLPPPRADAGAPAPAPGVVAGREDRRRAPQERARPRPAAGGQTNNGERSERVIAE